ncbi:MAG: hypothetical protein V9G19_14795 [Tetrasphaera sp.]
MWAPRRDRGASPRIAPPAPRTWGRLAALRAVDDGAPRLFVVADPEGRTAISTLNDARDCAAGIVLALDNPLAVVGRRS